MRKTSFALVSTLAFTASIGSAWAQTPAPATPPATTPPAATPPAATPPPASPPPAAATPAPAMEPAPAPAAEPAPAPAPEAAPAPAAEEESFPAAWFRIDSDIGSLQLWAGATHMLSDSVGIATDMYVLTTAGSAGFLSLGEFDLGPSFVLGSFYLTPMLGLQVDWTNRSLAALVPQLYLTGGPDPIYMELWLQNYAYTVFDKTGVTPTGGTNYIYGRLFIDYKMGKYVGIGPEIEFTYGLNDLTKTPPPDESSLLSLPVGLNVMLSNYGKNNVFYIFGGWETQDTPNDEHVAGRLTFVHNF